MDSNFSALAYLFSCGALGIIPEKTELDIKKVAILAKEQGVWDTVFVALKTLKDNGINEEKLNKLQLKFISKCANTLKNRERINDLLIEFKEQGIECVVLKGVTLAELYAYPETRQSGDVDLLINPADEQKAIFFLKSKGFSVKQRTENGNHSECKSETYGLIELHTSLYYNLMNDVWFNNHKMIKEEYIDKGNYKTLGITDGFLYCFLHAVKHFLSNGLSLRQVADTLLYIKKYKDKIDFNRVYSVLEDLKYKDFLFSIIGIGIEYMAFQKSDLIECGYSTDKVNLILEDMQKCGIFGKKQNFKNDLYYAYSKERFNKKGNGNFNSYVTNIKRQNAKGVISFGAKNLQKRYEFYNKNKYLYPVAVVCHFWYLLKTALKKPYLLKDTAKFSGSESQAVSEKLELIKKLNMI